MPLEIVYVLTNPAMPGLVKIGSTAQEDVEIRMKQLYSTGIPVPFDCEFACRVPDAYVVEKALHHAFGNARINPTREFFRVEPDRVIAILKLLHVDDVTAQIEKSIESDVTSADLQAAETLKKYRRPRMDFAELGVPVGAVLVAKDGGEQATVSASKLVFFRGEESSLTAATRKLLGLADDYALQPSPYWTYNGKSLKELYEDFHSGLEEA